MNVKERTKTPPEKVRRKEVLWTILDSFFIPPHVDLPASVAACAEQARELRRAQAEDLAREHDLIERVKQAPVLDARNARQAIEMGEDSAPLVEPMLREELAEVQRTTAAREGAIKDALFDQADAIVDDFEGMHQAAAAAIDELIDEATEAVSALRETYRRLAAAAALKDALDDFTGLPASLTLQFPDEAAEQRKFDRLTATRERVGRPPAMVPRDVTHLAVELIELAKEQRGLPPIDGAEDDEDE